MEYLVERRPVSLGSNWNLNYARVFRACAALVLAAALATGMVWGQAASAAEPITKVAEVRSLGENEAKQGRPVHLRGVVTALSGWKNSFFFQDETAGISVDPASAATAVRAGDEVEVSGITTAGLFAPNITATSVTFIGKGKLPRARALRYEQLQAGQQDSQWIALVGVTRSASVMELWGHRVLRLMIVTGSGKVEIRVGAFAGVDPEKLLDATVRVRGVCGTNFNDKRQLVGVRMFVTGMDDVSVLHPAPADPFSQPVMSIGNVLRFGSDGRLAHRVHVRATVTYQTLGRGLYLQDGDGGLRVNTTQDLVVKPGQMVEAVGFTAVHDQSPALDDSQIRLVGPGQMPAIPVVAAENVIQLRPDGFWSTSYETTLLSVEGHLVDSSEGPEGTTLVMHEGKTLFRARLRTSKESNDALAKIDKGSLIRVTGVCTVFRDEGGDPISFLVKLRSPNDVAIVQKPSWLNETRLLWLAGLLLLLAIGKVVQHSRQQKRVEKELAASRHRFQLFLDNSPAYAYIKDGAGRILWGNAAWEKLGYKPSADGAGKTDSGMWVPEISRVIRENDLAVHESGKSMEFLESLPIASGEVRHFLSTKFPFQDDSGAPMLGGMSLDITERIRVEERLQRSELQYRELFEKNPVPAWVYHVDTLAFLDVNQAAIDHYGYSREEFLGLTLRDVRMPEEVDAIERSFAARGENHPQSGWRHRRKDGSVIYVELRSHTIELNSQQCRLVMANDVTERFESETQFRVLFEESSDAHLLFDDSKLRDCNQAAVAMLRAAGKAAMLGVLRTEVPARLEGEALDYARARKEHLAMLPDEGSVRFDCLTRRFDGSDLAVEVSLTRVKVAGRPMVLEVWHDLTERKKMEQRLSKEALTDPLTGLANRRHFNQRLDAALTTSKLGGSRLTLCVGDLDFFKQINDRYGHSEGDQVLITIANLLRDGVRQSDCVARIGGDEFCMLFPYTSAAEVEKLLERVQSRLGSVCFGLSANVPFSVSATFGIAELLPSHGGANDLFEAADQALYRAKALGRNRIGSVVESEA